MTPNAHDPNRILRITGLDLSLTGTGVAHVDVERPPAFEPRVAVATRTIVSSGRKSATWQERASRLRRLRNAVCDQASRSQLVVLEGPAYASQVGSVWDRAGHFWNVVGALDHLCVPYVVVSPAQVKQFAAGKGNADKAAVAAGMTRLWGDRARPADDNQFDALSLATMGAVRVARRQLPISVLERHAEVVSSVAWPVVAVGGGVRGPGVAVG